VDALKNLSSKQRQKLLLVAVVIVAAILIIIISLGVTKVGTRSPGAATATPDRKMSLLTDKVEKDLWIAAEGHNIKALEKSNEELRAQIEGLRKEITETKEETKRIGQERAQIPPLPQPHRPSTQVFPLPGVGPGPATFPPPHGLPPSAVGVPPAEPAKPQRVEPPGASIRTFKDEVKDRKDEKVQPKKESKKPEQTTYLPSGSFMKAVLLSGMDAPTSGGSPAEPYPVLMGITDLSILPNRFRMNLKECFVIGAGYGNISDERAYIRTETLSCVRNDGGVIDVPLKGHVVGEDGKLGMRGRLVSKQGQQIAMSIFAGTLAGLGNALRPQQALAVQLAPPTISPPGVVRPDFGSVLEGAATGGVGRALDRVAEHYLKMAEKLFPIIEIDAGRYVEIIALKGQELKIIERKRS